MSEPRAIFLCAGRGSRARDVTGDIPKCLLEIDGEPLILRAIRQLADNGVYDVQIIVGYEADRIREIVGDRAHYHEYPDYESTNNLWTLASHHDLMVDRDVAVLFGDVIVSDEAMRSLWSGEGDLGILVDRVSQLPGTMRIRQAPDGVIDMGNHISLEEADGNYVGFLRARPLAATAVADAVASRRRAEEGRDAYFTAVVPTVTGHGLDVDLISLRSEDWAEIDTAEDYEIARERFRAATLERTDR